MKSIGITDNWVETDHGRIFSRSWRPNACLNETPIVLFHDSLGCVQLWRDFPEVLSKATGRIVIAYDRLGFGKSDKRNDEPTPDFISKEAEYFFPRVRNTLGFNQFIALGHSVGGAMAVVCAKQFPNACMAVITEAAQAFVEDRTLEGISLAKKNFEDPSQFAKIEKLHAEKALWVLKAWTDIWLSPDFASWSLRDILPMVRCPLLAIHGGKDEFGSLEFPKLITSLAGGYSEQLIISDCGHVPHREKETEVLNAIKTFIGHQEKTA